MNKYHIAFYYSPEDSAYITCVPELPGCMADGKTIQEALLNTESIVDDWLHFAKNDGRYIPKPLCIKHYSNATSADVANYILRKTGKITTLMLEKLTYYCKVWSLVWYGRSIIQESPEAWSNGPVFPRLYAQHTRKRFVTESNIHTNHELSEDEKKFIDIIVDVYGGFEAEELKDITHREAPWRSARGQKSDNERSTEKITDKAIIKYYQQSKG